MSDINEKLAQFNESRVASLIWAGNVLTLRCDTDSDPNTETPIILTVSNVEEEDLRVD